MTSGTAMPGTDSRRRPTTSPGRADTPLRASNTCPRLGPALSTRRRPASVSATLRVVRVRSTTRSCASSWRTE